MKSLLLNLNDILVIAGKRPKCEEGGGTPRCERKCEGNKTMSYREDKHYGVSSYGISSSVEQIQTEIMKNGPVEGAFTVYADFPSYKSGRYGFYVTAIIKKTLNNSFFCSSKAMQTN